MCGQLDVYSYMQAVKCVQLVVNSEQLLLPQSCEGIPLNTAPDPVQSDVSWQCQVQCREQSPALYHTAGFQVTQLRGAVGQLKNRRRKRLD